jgi:hypothetical protein
MPEQLKLLGVHGGLLFVQPNKEGFSLHTTEDFGEDATISISKTDAFKLVQWMMQQHPLDPHIKMRIKAYPIEGRPGKFKLEVNGEMTDEVVDEANLHTRVTELAEGKDV